MRTDRPRFKISHRGIRKDREDGDPSGGGKKSKMERRRIRRRLRANQGD